ncbi:unnamed protein product [Urochloa humidicola]
MRAATGGDSALPRRFAAALASGALTGVGGRWGLVESAEDVYIPKLTSPTGDDVDARRASPSMAVSPTSLVATESVFPSRGFLVRRYGDYGNLRGV